MYEIVIGVIFDKKNSGFYCVPEENGKGKNNITGVKEHEKITNFVRYFKTYVRLSTSLSIEGEKIAEQEFVAFRETLPKLTLIYDLEKNSRMYIFLEAICQLLLHQHVTNAYNSGYAIVSR
jgi:hypothetical protein